MKKSSKDILKDSLDNEFIDSFNDQDQEEDELEDLKDQISSLQESVNALSRWLSSDSKITFFVIVALLIWILIKLY